MPSLKSPNREEEEKTDPNLQLCKGRKEYIQEISYIDVIQEEI